MTMQWNTLGNFKTDCSWRMRRPVGVSLISGRQKHKYFAWNIYCCQGTTFVSCTDCFISELLERYVCNKTMGRSNPDLLKRGKGYIPFSGTARWHEFIRWVLDTKGMRSWIIHRCDQIEAEVKPKQYMQRKESTTWRENSWGEKEESGDK